MPRIRTIKPSFFTSDDVAALPLRARLTWIGLWTHCDDQGRAKDHARLIKAAIWPLDNLSLADIEDDLSTLASHGRIVRYQVAGQRYLAIVNWHAHQTINRPSKSTTPAPPETTDLYSVSPHETVTDDSHREGKGKEGNGREGKRADVREPDPPAPNPTGPEPPSRCPRHIDTPEPPPCGPCGDARRLNARWNAARTARAAASPKCPKHRGQPAHNCAPCRADALAAPTEGANDV